MPIRPAVCSFRLRASSAASLACTQMCSSPQRSNALRRPAPQSGRVPARTRLPSPRARCVPWAAGGACRSLLNRPYRSCTSPPSATVQSHRPRRRHALEAGERSGPARERHHAGPSRKIEHDMARRGVAGSGLQDNIRVQGARPLRLGVDDPRADRDLLEIRGRDRADVTGEARVCRALLCHTEVAAGRHEAPTFRSAIPGPDGVASLRPSLPLRTDDRCSNRSRTRRAAGGRTITAG